MLEVMGEQDEGYLNLQKRQLELQEAEHEDRRQDRQDRRQDRRREALNARYRATQYAPCVSSAERAMHCLLKVVSSRRDGSVLMDRVLKAATICRWWTSTDKDDDDDIPY